MAKENVRFAQVSICTDENDLYLVGVTVQGHVYKYDWIARVWEPLGNTAEA